MSNGVAKQHVMLAISHRILRRSKGSLSCCASLNIDTLLIVFLAIETLLDSPFLKRFSSNCIRM